MTDFSHFCPEHPDLANPDFDAYQGTCERRKECTAYNHPYAICECTTKEPENVSQSIERTSEPSFDDTYLCRRHTSDIEPDFDAYQNTCHRGKLCTAYNRLNAICRCTCTCLCPALDSEQTLRCCKKCIEEVYQDNKSFDREMRLYCFQKERQNQDQFAYLHSPMYQMMSGAHWDTV